MYELTLADIDAYLATKRECDIVGCARSCAFCIVAHALHYKYGGHWTATDSVITPRIQGSVGFIPSADIVRVIHDFDLFAGRVTKYQWVRLLYGNNERAEI